MLISTNRFTRSGLVVLLFLFFGSFTLLGETVVLNTDFNPFFSATNSPEMRVIAQGLNGRIVVGGTFTNLNGSHADGIAVFGEDGDPVPTFRRPAGYSLSYGSVRAIAVERFGGYIVSAFRPSVPGGNSSLLQFIQADGSDLHFFAEGLGLNRVVETIVVDDRNKVLIGGGFTTPLARLARINMAGLLDATFDPGTIFSNTVLAILLQPDARILAASSNLVVRLNTNGTQDVNFTAAHPEGDVYALALQPDGKILVGGNFPSVNNFPRSCLARLTPGGEVDPTFNPAGSLNGAVRTIALQADGSILIGGDFTEVQGIPSSGIARLNSFGIVDTHFNRHIPINGPIKALLAKPDGSILVGGAFSMVGGSARTSLCELNEVNLAIRSITTPTNGNATVTARGSGGLNVTMEGSDDLEQWHAITNTSLPAGVRSIEDFGATNRPQRFYRLKMTNAPAVDSLDAWSLSGDGSIMGMTWTGEQFICAESTGGFRTSADGVRWVTQSSGTSTFFLGVGFNRDLIIAVGDKGVIASSPDGITWSTRSHGTQTLHAVAWSGQRFAAVGANGTIISSVDGITWKTEVSGTTATLRAIIWDGQQFVATGGAGTILTSPDGISWTSAVSGKTVTLTGIACGGGRRVVVGGSSTLLTSEDGSQWTSRSAATNTSLRTVSWDGRQFIIVGGPGVAQTSPDGITWTARSTEITGSLLAVAGNGKIWVAAGGNSLGTSSDGVTWTPRATGVFALNGIDGGTSQFYAVGPQGTMISSMDGVTWNSRSFATTVDLNALCVTGSPWVAVGDGGAIFTPEGTNWISRLSGTSQNFSGVARRTNQWVAVGGSSDVATSRGGLSWTLCSTEISGSLHGVVATPSMFLAVGDSGAVVTSADGTNWTQSASGGSALLDVAWSGSIFVAVGANGVIRSSSDGTNWTLRSSGTTPYLWGVAWGGNHFVAVGHEGTILTSPDGITWRERKSGTTAPLLDVAFSGRRFVAVTSLGNVVRSGKLP